MDIKLPALLLGPCFWSLGWNETAATAAGVIKLKFEKGPRGCCSREVFLCQRPGPVLSQRLTKAVAASPPPSRDLRKPSEQSAPKRRRLFRIARLYRSRATRFYFRNAAAAEGVPGPSTPTVTATKPTILAIGISNALSGKLNRRSCRHNFRDYGACRGSRRVHAES